MTSPAASVSSLWRRWPRLADIGSLLLEIPVLAELLSSGHRHGDQQPASPWEWVFGQALILPLLARRRHPVGIFAALMAIAVLQSVTVGPSVADFAVLIALYTVAAHRDRRQAVAAAVVTEIGIVVASIAARPVGDGTVASIVFLTGIAAAALFLGTTLQARRDYLASLEDRAQRLERERDQQAELAATAERTRIAREMHDIVAHSLSVVITLADGAVAAADSDPAGARAAMQHVSETGRQALAEMRRLLGVLRDQSPADRSPQPGLDRVAGLLAEVRSAGLPVDYVVAGEPQQIPSTAEATVYRIVQESLTNVRKHAVAPTLARVMLRWSPRELTVEITDDGVGPVGVPPGGHDGHGLQGIAERVSLFDGEMTSGPVQPHGWRVCARLSLATVVL